MIAIAHSIADSIRQFLDKLFKQFRAPIPAVVLEVKQEEPPRKQRKYNKDKTKTFSNLLDNLEYTFNSVKLPTMKESWLEKDSIIGLKKIGIHVPNPWKTRVNHRDAKVDTAKPLPAIMCISTATADTVNGKKYMYPKIIFAVKLKKLPWQVARKTGIPYQFGMAFDIEEKLFWMHMYITVNKSTGEIQFCDELKVTAHKINREKTFYNKAWGTSSYLEDELRTVEERKQTAKNIFVSMHDWWSERDARWNVIVKKNGDRVTFGVDNSQTPYYFKDRDKSIKTTTGQTKKIVHYVKDHERKINDKTTVVKEHIRGLQDFNWNGYNCLVVSPKLQAQTSATFTVPAGDDDSEPSNVVYLSKVGKLLADLEEIRKPKEKFA
jgi:hypothetical protein